MNDPAIKIDIDSPRDAALCLSMVPGIGPKTYTNLLAAFETPKAVLTAEPSQLLTVPGVGQKLARDVAMATQQIDIRPQIELCEQRSIQIVDECIAPPN